MILVTRLFTSFSRANEGYGSVEKLADGTYVAVYPRQVFVENHGNSMFQLFATVFDPKTGEILSQDTPLTDPTQYLGQYWEVPRFELVTTTGQGFVVDVIHENGWNKHGWNQDGEIQNVGLNPDYVDGSRSPGGGPQRSRVRITIAILYLTIIPAGSGLVVKIFLQLIGNI